MMNYSAIKYGHPVNFFTVFEDNKLLLGINHGYDQFFFRLNCTTFLGVSFTNVIINFSYYYYKDWVNSEVVIK